MKRSKLLLSGIGLLLIGCVRFPENAPNPRIAARIAQAATPLRTVSRMQIFECSSYKPIWLLFGAAEDQTEIVAAVKEDLISYAVIRISWEEARRRVGAEAYTPFTQEPTISLTQNNQWHILADSPEGISTWFLVDTQTGQVQRSPGPTSEGCIK